MRLRGDERGQAIQIGFILIFGILIISFATYQAFVVPSQNKQVEFKHSQKVQGQLQELRNAIVSSVSRSTTVAVAVDLGTTYPSRIVAANPPPPSGVLQTVGSADPSVDVGVNNAVATRQEAADYWNGSRRTFTTGLLEYRPDYNEYRSGPVTVYDNTVLYNQFDEANRTITGQTMVDGDQITLVVLNGTLRAARPTSYSVDVRPVSTPAGATLVTPEAGEALSVTFTSRLPPEKWNETLSTEYDGAADDFEDRYVTGVSGTVRPDGRYDITVTFEDATYQLRMVKVGVGTGVTGTSATYLTDVSGEGASVEQGASTQVTLSVRDGFGNPKADVTVNASASAGSFQDPDDTKSTAADGTVTFTYETTGSTPTGTQKLNFSLRRIGSGFDQSATENVTVNVSVTSAGGGTTAPYTVFWTNNSDEPGLACSSPDSCVLDSTVSSSVELVMGTDPTADGALVQYAVNDTSVATVSPKEGITNTTGYNATTLSVQSLGTVKVYTSSGVSGDTLVIEIVGPEGLVWKTTLDWDSARDEVAVVHETFLDEHAADVVELGYPTTDSYPAYWDVEPVSYYPFDEDSGTTATDVIDGDNGALNNVDTGVTGVVDTTAYRFSGNGYVDLGSGTAAEIGGGGFAVSTWVYDPSGGNGDTIFHADGNSELYAYTNDAGTLIINDAGSTLNTGTQLDDGQWHHVVVTRSSTGPLEVYVDGSLTASESSSSATIEGSDVLSIGRRRVCGFFGCFSQGLHDGRIDEVRFYGQGLLDREVQNLYQVGSGGSLTTGWKTAGKTLNVSRLQLTNVVASPKQSQGGSISVTVLSDTDGDGTAEEVSDPIALDGSGGPYGVTGLSTNTDRFALKIQLTTTDPTVTPVLDKAELKEK